MLFVDPVADLAVLGPPDLFNEAKAYDALVENALPLRIGRPRLRQPDEFVRSRGFLLSLDGRWFGCEGLACEESLTIEQADGDVEAGMSGSPLISESGDAVLVVTTNEWPQAFLARLLPVWLSEDMSVEIG